MIPLFRRKHSHTEEVIPPLIPKALSDDDRPFIIRLKDLEKTYDPGTPLETKALRGISFEISLAEIVIIFGPSGSGKSTLLNILAGLDEPTGGEALIDNKDLRRMNAREKAEYHQFKVGMVFQSYNLVGTLTVIQNITMPARLAGFKKKEYFARGDDLLKQFDLQKLRNKLPSQCSGGQQQRVGIMRAFMNRPALIIADEPTGNLDSASSKQIMELFKSLNAETNTTMIVVTHDPALFAIADRVVHVLDGQVVKQTILTPKAKIDPKTATVPIEFKYRTEDIDSYIRRMKGGGEEGAAQKSQQEIIKEKTEELEKREEKLRKFWQQIRSLEESIDKRSQELAHERATIARENEKVTHERQQLLADEITIRQQREEIRGQSATLQHVLKEELADIEAKTAQEKRRLEAARRALQKKEVLIGHQRKENQALRADLLAQHERLKMIVAKHEQAVISLEKEKTEVTQKRQLLALEHIKVRQLGDELKERAANVEIEEKKKLARARSILMRERDRLLALRDQLAKQESSHQQTKAILAQEKAELEQDRTFITHERQRISEDKATLEQLAKTTKEEARLAEHTRAMLQARKGWVDDEEKRLRAQEEELLAAEESFEERLRQAQAQRREEERAILGRIENAKKELQSIDQERQKRFAEAEDILAQAKAKAQAMQREWEDRKTKLEQEKQLLASEKQDLTRRKRQEEKEMQLRVATATNIIDHEKEQLESEHQDQVAELKRRNRIMERKLAAARGIVEKETSVIAQEHKLLEEERRLQELERQRIEAERKRIEEEWGRLKKTKK